MSLWDFVRSSSANHHMRGHIPLDEALGDVERGPHQGDVLGDPAAYGIPAWAGLYDPDPGRPEFCESDYQPYLWEMPVHPTPLLRAPLPDEPGPPRPPDYDACLITDELFERAMRDAIDSLRVSEQPFAAQEASPDEPVHEEQMPDGSVEWSPGSDPIQEIENAIAQAQAEATPPPAGPGFSGLAAAHDPDFLNPFGMIGPAV